MLKLDLTGQRGNGPHRYAHHKMWPIVTRAAWSVFVCLMVSSLSCENE